MTTVKRFVVFSNGYYMSATKGGYLVADSFASLKASYETENGALKAAIEDMKLDAFTILPVYFGKK